MAHIHAAIIKAWADGADIQVRDAGSGGWIPVLRPKWNPDRDYRVAPRVARMRVAQFAGGYRVIPDTEYVEVSRGASFIKWADREFEVAL